jgi:hypothetical protein
MRRIRAGTAYLISVHAADGNTARLIGIKQPRKTTVAEFYGTHWRVRHVKPDPDPPPLAINGAAYRARARRRRP